MACVVEFPEGGKDEGEQIFQAINQSTDVTKIIKQAICLPQCDLLIQVNLQMATSKLELAIWLVD